MLTPQTLQKLPDDLIDLVSEVQTDIIKSIAKKLVKADYLTPSAEWQLYNYPVHKQLLLQYQRRCADIAPSVSQLDRPKGRRGHGYGSITEGEALRMAKIAERMGNLAWFVEAVDDILPLLSPAERHILEQRYFAAAPRPVWQIANDIYISRSEYYRHRDHLLWKFGRRFGLF